MPWAIHMNAQGLNLLRNLPRLLRDTALTSAPEAQVAQHNNVVAAIKLLIFMQGFFLWTD